MANELALEKTKGGYMLSDDLHKLHIPVSKAYAEDLFERMKAASPEPQISMQNGQIYIWWPHEADFEIIDPDNPPKKPRPARTPVATA